MSLFSAYLSGEAARFYGAHFADADARRAAVARAARPLAPEVGALLEQQCERFGTSARRRENLAALRAGAAAVVTGQQVGLLLGPLFNLYKAATAVVVARRMQEESGSPVVPVFWLQTEDHDLAEIAEVRVLSHHPTRLAVPASTENRISLAHLTLPAQVEDCLACLEREIGALPHAREHLDRLHSHYRAGRRWADAFGCVLSELFADDGLVVMDARDPAASFVARQLHGKALQDAAPIAEALLQRTRELEAAGFEPLVHVREGSPLSFFHPEGAEHARFRLEPRGDAFTEVGGAGSHTPRELLSALDRDPLCFSTSALLRPIFQDMLLPTAAYVGGPGEVAYFAQLQPLYEAYGMTMPLVVPRARIHLLDERAHRICERLRIDPDVICRSEDEWLAAAASERDGDNPAAELLRRFEADLQRSRSDIERAGPGLAEAAAKTHASVERSLLKLAEKIERARLHRDEALVHDVRRQRAWLQPDGVPQERVYGMSYFAARYGERAFLDQILGAIAGRELEPGTITHVLPDDAAAQKATS